MRPMIGGFLRPKSERFGGDFAGIAEAVGKSVTDVGPGDEVFGVRTGAFAEYVNVKTAVAQKPANLSFEEAAGVPIAALTALEALQKHGRLQRGVVGPLSVVGLDRTQIQFGSTVLRSML